MTNKQIEAAKRTLPQWDRGTPPQLTSQQKIYEQELSCRGMINSCLIYGQRYSFYDDEKKEFGKYAQDYIKYLGEEEVTRIWNEQIEDFSKAEVQHNVHADVEGCSYNSCKWADD